MMPTTPVVGQAGCLFSLCQDLSEDVAFGVVLAEVAGCMAVSVMTSGVNESSAVTPGGGWTPL